MQNSVEFIDVPTNLDAWINAEISAGFNLSDDIPVRIKVIKTDVEDEIILLITLHHIAYDGWSKAIISQDIISTYNRLKNGAELEADLDRITYKDYVYWHEEKLTEQGRFWESFFKEKYSSLNFPLDYSRSTAEPNKGSLITRQIGKAQLDGLKKEIKKRNISLADYFIGAIGTLLNAYTGQDKIVVGTITSGRNHIDLENLVSITAFISR